ncbi:MAG: hypothetical protein ACREJ3_02075, partial [Polyangiaceae bacterium]
MSDLSSEASPIAYPLARNRVTWLVLASLLVTVALPFLGRSRYGDLSNWYSDHLHHAYATWVFCHRGFEVYERPLAEVSRGIEFAHPFIGPWGFSPIVYPPGVFLVFLPLAIVGELVPMSLATFGALNVAVLVVIAHAALWSAWTALGREPPGARLLAGAFVWLVLLRLSLNGFYDVVWLACGAAMVLAVQKERYGRALLWAAAAAFLHFRAVSLAPLALFALLRMVRGKP